MVAIAGGLVAALVAGVGIGLLLAPDCPPAPVVTHWESPTEPLPIPMLREEEAESFYLGA